MNGRPALHEGMKSEEWREVFSGAFADLKRRAGGKKKRKIRIDPYAVEDDGEFFAVTTEYFFEQPDVLNAEYPEVYRLLGRFYRQDPRARMAR